MNSPETRRAPRSLIVPLLGILLAIGFLALRLGAISTEGVNWDEFAFFARAADSIESGTLQLGSRPGLGTLSAIPFVRGCTDEIEVVRRARLLWTTMVLLAAAALWWLVHRVASKQPSAKFAASAAVALWCLVPLFERWSLQVRTDQAAILFSLVAGCLLLASSSRPYLALLAGASGGVAFLFTQKAIYHLALVALLAAGERWIADEIRWRREVTRAGFALAGGLVVIRGFYLGVAAFFEVPQVLSVAGGLAQLDFYREMIGFELYRGVLPTLGPHLILLALVAGASVGAGRLSRAERRLLALSWAVLALGVAVAWFHTGAFAYFWMTPGLFLALGLGLGSLVVWARWGDRFVVRATLLGASAALLLQGTTAAVALLEDTQAVQHESLLFLQRNFPPGEDGFHLDRAPFCRHEKNPLPIFFGEHIRREFGGPDRERNVRKFVERFNARGVYFLLHSNRMGAFPRSIQQFWLDHFVPYYKSVWLPGFRLERSSAPRASVETLVGGSYRLIPSTPGAAAVTIDGRALRAGETIELDAGWHEVEFSPGEAPMLLAWAVGEPPEDPGRLFYGEAMVAEIRLGRGPRR